ncbi:glycosyltransferase family 4 protein [Millisia brevis]|uniref:glycosyltransferase family 4 protein n=1 Tax=Millisia brevis TaxID=264148 RepID=UPI0008370BF3|nr:glycosyltransferase family 1 protein [Millisia brevis]
MRVAIVAESFLPTVNGVANSVVRILDALERRGHEALVVAPDTPSGLPPADREYRGVPVVRCRATMVPKVSSLPVAVPPRNLPAIIRRFEPDVVHAASPFVLGAAGVLIAHRQRIPTIAVYQTDVAGFAESYGLGTAGWAAWRWTAYVHRRATRTLAPSTTALDALIRNGIPNSHRWAEGVDSTLFRPSARSPELLERFGRRSGKLVVGFVGRLAPEKHVERLRPLADDPSIQLVIVGDGPERARLERELPTALFMGQLLGEDLAAAYASFDVFVHPGEHETYCQTVQEALSSGVPVIAPDAGGPRDLVTHCRDGFLLPVDRFEQLLPATVAGLADPAVRERLGGAARRSVLPRTWPAVCDELLDHYQEVRALPVRRRRAA